MITRIGLNGVACFKSLATLETNKRVNLVYGLNGTGKTTLSNFLYKKDDGAFSDCFVEGSNTEEVRVYNQEFIRDYFYESDNLPGIFTLSRENKEAEEKIRHAEKETLRLEEERGGRVRAISQLKADLSQEKQNAENKVWEIKTTYTGGDRVLEFCLEGLKGQKEKLFNHLRTFPKPPQKPDRTTKDLKKEAESLKGEDAHKYLLLPVVIFSSEQLESNPIFQKEIIGNQNSSVARLIGQLNNSDWVKEGLNYLSSEIDDAGKPCPFCQENTITKTLVANIESYFDEVYQADMEALGMVLSDYKTASGSIGQREDYETHPFIIESRSEFANKYDAVVRVVSDNVEKIERKIKTPSQKVSLEDSSEAIQTLNEFLLGINRKTEEHNKKTDNKDQSLLQIKEDFWSIMRWDYDQTVESHQRTSDDVQKKLEGIVKEMNKIDEHIESQKKIIHDQQKSTVNIKEAIANINNGLIDLGIDNFSIVEHSDILYKIVRDEQMDNTFQTLSEGEKMIISFLYFCELCKGRKNATEVGNKRIVVIDDPISSLSHIYVFNVGQLIKNDFFRSSEMYDQIFVLTHSLYFFYELTDTSHERRERDQKLFRMIKNSDGSQILDMKYEEIQNDYHSYWYIVKNDKQPPALIANCMRNIIEYFFNFIEKRDFNNVFQKPELKQNKYQAFRRYMDRESHSLGQNIFDYKEFNYSDFREAFRLLFKENGYEDHYKLAMTT